MPKKKDSFQPWLSRPAINRSVTIPFTRPLTQRVSNLHEFHPNELDPFLLFDARHSMLGELEAETLDLNPADPSTLEVITASRTGVATYTDAEGVIQSAPENTVRVDHTQGEELTPTKFQRIGYTDFSSGWSNANSTFVDGSGFSGNVSKILTGTSSSGAVDSAVVTKDGVTYTGSFYIRRVNGTGNLEFAIYGSASSDATPLFTQVVSTDWVRVDLQFLGKSGGGNVYFGLKLQVSGDSVEISQPQVEEGTTASDFVPNTTGSPKFITGATFGPRVPMMLIEPSATNLLTYSEDFSDSSWTKGGASLVSGFASPDGNSTAFKLVEDNTNDRHRIGKATFSANVERTLSVFAKKGERKYISLFENNVDVNGLSIRGVIFNLESGTFYNNDSSYYSNVSIELVSDGWYRLSVTMTNNGLQVPSFGVSADGLTNYYQGDGTSGLYLWGAQVETGSVATSYIPTSGSTVTRQSDNLSITGSDFTDFYNQSEGTWYCEVVPKGNDGSATYTFILEYGVDNDDRVGFFYYPSDGHQSITAFSSGLTFYNQDAYGDATNQLTRMSYSYKSGNHKSAINGTSDSDTDVGVASANQLVLGRRIHSSNNGKLIGHLRRILYWPTHSDRM